MCNCKFRNIILVSRQNAKTPRFIFAPLRLCVKFFTPAMLSPRARDPKEKV